MLRWLLYMLLYMWEFIALDAWRGICEEFRGPSSAPNVLIYDGQLDEIAPP